MPGHSRSGEPARLHRLAWCRDARGIRLRASHPVQASSGSLSPRPIHLHPAAPLAERVLLPGDPARALLLAQALLDKPLMFNHHRGLWGYSGQAADGQELTIQSTGMGGPSAAIVISELADLGAGTLIRVGTCGALRPELALGDLLAVTEALAFDGTGSALAAGQPLRPDAGLLEGLRAAGSLEQRLDGIEAALERIESALGQHATSGS